MTQHLDHDRQLDAEHPDALLRQSDQLHGAGGGGGSFKTLVINDLSGTGGGTFGMNINLPALKGDLLVINTSECNYPLSDHLPA